MAKLVQSILCARVIIDQVTNSVSYIDVIEHIVVPKFPAILHQAILSLHWNREKEDEELVFSIDIDWPGITIDKVIEPDKQILNKQSHRFNLTLNGIKIENTGNLSFVVKQLVGNKWKTTQKLSYPIMQAEEQQFGN